MTIAHLAPQALGLDAPMLNKINELADGVNSTTGVANAATTAAAAASTAAAAAQATANAAEPAGVLKTVTVTGATPVAVTDAGVTANSTFAWGLKTVGGTVGALPTIQTITPGSDYTVAATAGDTSTYNVKRFG